MKFKLTILVSIFLFALAACSKGTGTTATTATYFFYTESSTTAYQSYKITSNLETVGILDAYCIDPLGCSTCESEYLFPSIELGVGTYDIEVWGTADPTVPVKGFVLTVNESNLGGCVGYSIGI